MQSLISQNNAANFVEYKTFAAGEDNGKRQANDGIVVFYVESGAY